MYDFEEGSFEGIVRIWHWVQCFFADFKCHFLDWIFGALEEILGVLVQALAIIPIPGDLTSFTWPDAGPLATALVDLQVPQALSILVAAFTVRFLKGLIPLIRS